MAAEDSEAEHGLRLAIEDPNTTFCANGYFTGFDVKGKMVLCECDGGIARIEKGAAVMSASGVGMILMNQAPDRYNTLVDAHVLPASHVAFAGGYKILSYINSTASPVAGFSFKGTILDTSFSSRGPNLSSSLSRTAALPGLGKQAALLEPFA
ncbi:subtilisin-like protease SBT1.7 [Canna indica]|uniref:Subtilisin-like protease SBT1.7 n=1 Tax=Canna indica TaxID=4628 RepID=A0AAQ3JSK6_9LILI|nr:subtilisin-like protease SBT1.7 [Canna indica]